MYTPIKTQIYMHIKQHVRQYLLSDKIMGDFNYLLYTFLYYPDFLQ